jgi:hypothetical protein
VRQLGQIKAAAAGANLPFLVIGGWAVCAHGYARLTNDLDLLARKEDRENWNSLLDGMGYVSSFQPPSFGHWNPPDLPAYTILDVMFVNDSTFQKMWLAAQEVGVEGTASKIPSLEHLMALKLHALRYGGERRKLKDHDDLNNLITVNRVDTKSDSFRELCLKFGTKEIYERLRGKT